MTDYTSVATTNQLDPGESMVVDVEGEEVVLVNDEGEYYAVKNECTHQGWDLDEGDVKDGVIICPLHRGSFDLETGEPMGPPPDTAVPCFDVKVEGSDIKIKH